MTFKSKRDGLVTSLIVGALILLLAAAGWPIVYMLVTNDIEWGTLITLLITLVISCGLVAWTWLDIEYTMREDHLFIRGGLFRSKIPYNDISSIKETNGIGDVLYGYRILAAKEGLRIYYRYAVMGSVVISPKNKQVFIEELKKRCPTLR